MRSELIVTASLVWIVGCGVEPEAIESMRQAVNTVAMQHKDAAASGQSAAPGTTGTFTPKYPDRVDPFSFADAEESTVSAEAGMTTMAEIKVLGFARVDEPRVLLQSGELTRSLQVGESLRGVRVVRIQESSVELQLGTLIWTATMFD